MRKTLLVGLALVVALATTGDSWVYAATCTPLAQGKCTACKNCKYCGNCAKQGGKCSVCKPPKS